MDCTLPAATGGDGHPSYTYALTPDVSGIGLTFDPAGSDPDTGASTRTLTGTPSSPSGKVTYTYTATETSDDDDTLESASVTFTIGVAPKKPTGLTATALDDHRVRLKTSALCLVLPTWGQSPFGGEYTLGDVAHRGSSWYISRGPTV